MWAFFSLVAHIPIVCLASQMPYISGLEFSAAHNASQSIKWNKSVAQPRPTHIGSSFVDNGCSVEGVRMMFSQCMGVIFGYITGEFGAAQFLREKPVSTTVIFRVG